MLEQLNNPDTFIVIGRGHSGTRLISFALQSAGVFMGAPHNVAGDLIPPQPLYEAARIIGPKVSYKGKYQWDFQAVHNGEIPKKFEKLLAGYLVSLLTEDTPKRGWKLPETTLIYPWLVRLLPDANYIFWMRDPRDSILGMHGTDRLEKWGIPCKRFLFHNYQLRAASWKYQYDIVQATPKPKRFVRVRFEDFVLQQETTVIQLEKHLGLTMERQNLNPAKVGVHKKKWLAPTFSFVKPAMRELGYL